MKKGQTSIALSCWRLDEGDRTAVFASFEGSTPCLIHFGATLPDQEDLSLLARLTLPNTAGGQLDPLTPLSLIPSAIEGWQGHPGLSLLSAAGQPATPDLVLADAAKENGILTFTLSDRLDRVSLTLDINLDDAGLLSLSAHATPQTGSQIGWLCAGAIPIPDRLSRILDHGGRWTGEFQKQERLFATGQHVRESREGRTGHAHFPGAAFLAEDCGETSGECLGVSLAWSGGHRMIAEEIPDGRRQVQFGVADDGVSDQPISSPTVHLAWSKDGLNGLSEAFHALGRRFSRTKLASRAVPRPVHYNCWEAIYFRHSPEDLKQIASRAADLGAERFVLDDGWFKGRNDDTTSLGDWSIDRNKYPDGLTPLIDHVQSLGMRFGIWFEPEMVNLESDLARAHPDWLQGPEGQPAGRQQYVLDLTNSGASDYLFDHISAILSEHAIDYIKWDHNRILTGGTSSLTVALYRLFERLEAAFPDVEIESCASGGGRVDFGILGHTTRVWLSDSNDALERLRMQHEASRWIAPEIQGSHVGPRTCHTSGRVLPMAFRAWVAAQRHMGFEMDPRELTADEAATLKRVTSWFKANRDFLFSARLLRLDTEDPEVHAEVFASTGDDTNEGNDQFVLFHGQTGAPKQIATRPYRLAGLRSEAFYDIRLINPEDLPRTLNQNVSSPFSKGESVRLSGAALMAGALRLPNAFPATMLVVEGQSVRPGVQS